MKGMEVGVRSRIETKETKMEKGGRNKPLNTANQVNRECNIFILISDIQNCSKEGRGGKNRPWNPVLLAATPILWFLITKLDERVT